MARNLKLRLESLRCLRCTTVDEYAADRPKANDQWFIPQLSLYQTLTNHAVRQALQGAGIESYRLDEITQTVLNCGIKIFAILVLINQVAQTLRFIEESEFHDQRLPFDLNSLYKRFSLASATIEFSERQWEVIAPTFHRGTINKIFNEKSILPFAKDFWIGQGAFGTVYQIELHSGHQQIEDHFPHKVCKHIILG